MKQSDIVAQLRLAVRPPPVSYSAFSDTGSLDSTFRRRTQEVLQELDRRRYGISLEEFQRTLHNDEAQANFENQYGISFVEYCSRLVSGESMGDSMQEGRWSRHSEGPPESFWKRLARRVTW